MESTNIKIESSKGIDFKIITYVIFSFIGYFLIGLPLAIIPIFITKNLGFSELVAGIVISLQYITTFLMRSYAGKIVDTKGPKPAVLLSMMFFGICGILLYLTHFFHTNAFVSLTILIVARLVTGCAEGMVGASPINWAILKFGKNHTAKAISFNGVASYGGLALAAPLGVVINNHFGLEGIGILTLLLGVIAYFLANSKQNIISDAVKVEQSFFKVLKIIAPLGLCLTLAGLGFGGISNFITLYYEFFGWANAALCLTVFSVVFIIGRLIFNNSINRYGGIKVGIVCMTFETIGLLILFLATTPNLALLGAGITGLGFSLVFPAFGVKAVSLVSDSNKGAALAAYGLFIDISLGITGPLIGGVIGLFGMHSLFLSCCIMVFLGLLLSLYLNKKYQ